MTAQPSVSVVLCTYNGERFLRQQLDSLAGQTYLPTELVIGDDCSSDSTVEIAECFARDSPFPVRVIRSPSNKGHADNFLETAVLATSEWLAFCDQDDVWFPQKLERCIRAAQQPGVLAVAHNSTEMEDGQPSSDLVDRRILADTILEPLTEGAWRAFPGHAVVAHRSLVTDIPFVNRPHRLADRGGREYHDDWICFLALSLSRFALVAEPLSAYRRHGHNASQSHWRPQDKVGRLREIGSRDPGHFALSAQQLLDRSTFLTSLELPPDSPISRDPLEAAVAHYGEAADLTRQRLDIYETRSVWARARTMAAVLHADGYRHATLKDCGGREAIKDLFGGVLQMIGPISRATVAAGSLVEKAKVRV